MNSSCSILLSIHVWITNVSQTNQQSVSEKAKSLDLRAGKAKNKDIFSVFYKRDVHQKWISFYCCVDWLFKKNIRADYASLPLKTTAESKSTILSLFSVYQSLEVAHVLMSNLLKTGLPEEDHIRWKVKIHFPDIPSTMVCYTPTIERENVFHQRTFWGDRHPEYLVLY